MGLNVEVDAFEHFELSKRLVYVFKSNHFNVGLMVEDDLLTKKVAIYGLFSQYTAYEIESNTIYFLVEVAELVFAAAAALMPSFFMTIEVTSVLSASLITMPACCEAFLSTMYT